MSEVMDFAESFDAAQGTLTEMAALAAREAGRLQGLDQQLDGAMSEITSLEQAAAQQFEALLSEVQGAGALLVTGREQVVATAQKLTEQSRAAQDVVGTVEKAVDSAYADLQARMDDTMAKVGEAYQEAQDTVDQAMAIQADVFTEMSNAREATEKTLAEARAGAEQLDQKLSEVGQDTINRFAEVGSTLVENIGSQIVSQFEQSTDLLGNVLVGQASDGFDQVWGSVEQRLGEFETLFNDLGQRLMQEVTQVGQQVASHAEDEASKAVEKEFDDFVHDAVEALVGEVADSLSAMTLGASVTGALGPMTPALVAAKALVGSIKAALDLLRKFGF